MPDFFERLSLVRRGRQPDGRGGGRLSVDEGSGAGRHRGGHSELQQRPNHRSRSEGGACGTGEVLPAVHRRHRQLRRRFDRRHARGRPFLGSGCPAYPPAHHAIESRTPAVLSVPRDSGEGQRVPGDIRTSRGTGCKGLCGRRCRPAIDHPGVDRPADASGAAARLRFRGSVLSPPQIRRNHHEQHRLPADARAVRQADPSADRRRLRTFEAAGGGVPEARRVGDRRGAVRHRYLDDHGRGGRRLPGLPELPGSETARCQGSGPRT